MTRPWKRRIDTIRVRLSKSWLMTCILPWTLSLVMLILLRGHEPELLSYRNSRAFNGFGVISLSIIHSYFTNCNDSTLLSFVHAYPGRNLHHSPPSLSASRKSCRRCYIPYTFLPALVMGLDEEKGVTGALTLICEAITIELDLSSVSRCLHAPHTGFTNRYCIR